LIATYRAYTFGADRAPTEVSFAESSGLKSLLPLFAVLAASSSVTAQSIADIRPAFRQWTQESLHRVSNAEIDASTTDLMPIGTMIGDARIVGLSEGIHAAAEPLIFRNRLFKHLVERLGFDAIAIESGIVESRVLNDYVTQGKGDFDSVLKQGFSNGFDTFRQNRELIRWMHDHNARLPPKAVKLQIFGLDVPGSPGNFDAARGPDTALQTALEYLRTVDREAAADMHTRVDAFLPVLKGINGYGELGEAERNTLTATIADLVALLERQRFAYVAKSSKEEFDWAERAAIGARQTDTWFRRMPLAWKLDDGLAWTQYGMQVRDRSMADNLEWVLGRIGARGRVLVFGAVGHVASTLTESPVAPFRGTIPMGAYVRERHGPVFINILNVFANGEIKYCSANPQRLIPLKPPPQSAVETLFAAVKVPRYLLDLRQAPPGVAEWMRQVHEHWNGLQPVLFATADAFDIAYFVSPVTPACASS
jgi:erythromycin esterase